MGDLKKAQPSTQPLGKLAYRGNSKRGIIKPAEKYNLLLFVLGREILIFHNSGAIMISFKYVSDVSDF